MATSVQETIDDRALIGVCRLQMQITAENICMSLCWQPNDGVSDDERY